MLAIANGISSVEQSDELIGRLVTRGVKLTLEGNDLLYSGSDDVLDEETITALRRAKNDLVSRLQSNRTRGVLRLGATTREQRRMEWRSRIDRHAATYNVCIRIDLKGPVEAQEVERVAHSLVERHEILRTRFAWYGKYLIQEITSAPRAVLQILEPAALNGASDEEVLNWCTRRGEAAFNLAADFPSRWCYAAIAPSEAVLLLTIHHIACDGWSIERLLKEFHDLLNLRPLAAVSYTPSDFAEHEQRWLTSERIKTATSFWTKELCGSTFHPTFRRSNGELNVGGSASRVIYPFPADLNSRVADMARKVALTEFTLYLAAFALLLREETSTDSCAVVIAVANRTRADHEEMMGLARNAQAIPCSARSTEDLVAIARRISAVVERASQFLWFPIDLLPAPGADGVDTRRLPITFAFERSGSKIDRFNGSATTMRYVFMGAARGGLSLFVRRQGEEADVLLDFATEHFSAQDATEMARRYVSFVVTAVDDWTKADRQQAERIEHHDSYCSAQ